MIFNQKTLKKLGANDRKKRISLGKILPFILFCIPAGIISIMCVSWYTDWILHRVYDPTQDKMVKKWIPSLSFFGEALFTDLANDNIAAIKNVIFSRDYPEKSAIPSIRLSIQKNGFDTLNSQIFKYGQGFFEKKQRINGLYNIPGKPPLPVSINLRGVMPYHHMVWKPSLRIKFKRKKTLNQFRNHLLVAPEDGTGFRNWITTELSRNWNMLNIGDHFVRLFVNNKYMGIYNRMWRLDESLFINSGYLPGYFFNLEHLDKREFQRVWRHWTRGEAWGIVGQDQKKGKELLNRALIISNINYNWIAKYGRKDLMHRNLTFNEFIDKEAFAKYLALLCHAGETHVDSMHNNSFWLDPVNGKIIPILEDVTGYDFPLSEGQLHRSITRQDGAFIQLWLQNPNNVELYLQKLIEVLDTFGSAQNLETLIRGQWKTVRPSALADINASKTGGQKRSLVATTDLDQDIERIVGFIKERNQWIKEQLNNSRLSIASQSENEFEIFLDSISGVFAERKDGITFSLKGDDRSYTSVKLKVANNLVKSNYLKSFYKIPDFYAFYTLPGKPEEYNFTHSLTQKNLDFSPAPEHVKLFGATAGLNMLEILKPNQTPITLGPGNLIIEKTKEFQVGQPVVIKSGTNLILGPKVSLIIRGPLKIEGTLEAPVSVRPLEPEKPFGVLALLGKEAKRSRIRYLDMEGGSIHRRNNLEFTGMFSVHDNPNIEIANSRFGRNFIGDDAVHFMRSKVKIKNSVFENSLSDAMDWDLVDGEISNSIFRNSGNDGLDLSMGKINVSNSQFEKSGDKCISAGEGTNVTVMDSKFLQCNVGIAVKDRSKVKLTNNLFSENKIAYNTYRKKWRWEKGGEGVIRNTTFIGSIEADIKGDKLSKVAFIGPIPKNIQVEGKLQLASSPKL
jgi:hypothetical protein